MGVGTTLTYLYLENGQSHKKFVGILHKENFIKNIRKKTISRNAPYTKTENNIFTLFGLLFLLCAFDKKKLLEGHPMNISTKFVPCRLSDFREILKQYMDMDDSD